MYKLFIENRVKKEVESLPSHVIDKVLKAINSLRDNPRPHGVKKLFVEDGWRIKISDYRVLYTIDDKLKIVTIYRVKHRREAYR